MQAPGDIAGGAHQVFLALASAHLLGLLDEGVVGSPYPLQEKVVPIQELAVALEQVHGNGQHPPQNVGKAVPQLHTQSLLARGLLYVWNRPNVQIIHACSRSCKST